MFAVLFSTPTWTRADCEQDRLSTIGAPGIDIRRGAPRGDLEGGGYWIATGIPVSFLSEWNPERRPR